MSYSCKVEGGKTRCQPANQAERMSNDGKGEKSKPRHLCEGREKQNVSIYNNCCVFVASSRAEDVSLTTFERVASQV